MQRDTRLSTVYKRFDPYLYGSVFVVGPEAIAPGELFHWSGVSGYPFYVAFVNGTAQRYSG